MHNSYRIAARNASMLRNAPPVRAIEADDSPQVDRLSPATCFMIWVGLIASTWGGIAFIVSLF